ncbi:hypothetical protein OIV83_003562 [Microbotryomycetes sp. JL201]|nr:hypothetical protein OIV83_003562 [Microbotryomycetes sp. JL201]
MVSRKPPVRTDERLLRRAVSGLIFLITGANRRLGLAYANELLKRGHSVIACCRDPVKAQGLQKLAKDYPGMIEIIKYDDAAAALEKSALASDGIDVLVSSAGVLLGGIMYCLTERPDPIADLDDNFEVNTIGMLNTVLTFLPFLRKKQSGKKRIFVVSSQGGSLGRDIAKTPIGAPCAASKAAANMLALKFKAELENDGFFVAPFHPGGRIEVTLAAKMGVDVFFGAKPEKNGKCLSYDGGILPW